MKTEFHMSAILSLWLAGFGAVGAAAAPVTLTFEGLLENERILAFYNGGTGNLGSSGPDVGVVFGLNAQALIDADVFPPGGNFANEPSPDTVLISSPLTTTWTMNVPNGFGTSLSLKYSIGAPATVAIYEGQDGTGAVLASENLVAQGTAANGCQEPGDPTGQFACWDEVVLNFAGSARSLVMSGVDQQFIVDDITLDPNPPQPPDGFIDVTSDTINVTKDGVIPVVIYGTESFDVTLIDLATLEFGPLGAVPIHASGGHFEDTNEDGLVDLVTHYRRSETGIELGHTEACLTGALLDGTPIGGCDAIRTVSSAN